MSDWRENIRHVKPYTPGEQPTGESIVKLNTNENPYPPAPEVEEVLREAAQESGLLRKYPDPEAGELVRALAAFYGLSPDQVFVGVGSDDVLALSFLTFFHSFKPLLFPDITYSFYEVWARLFHIPFVKIPLDADFRLRKEDYFQENGGIIFPNPNAPTGIEESLADIEEILRRNPGSVVIVDEAYVDFGAKSAVELTRRYDNLLVVQTFSKSRSMAGVRIGFALGQPELIRALNDVKYSFNSYTMSRLAIKAGAAALKNRAYFEQTTGKIAADREKAKDRLRQLGFQCTDSRTNFLFVTHPAWEAAKLYEDLKRENIYVRYFRQPRIDNYLRITIGTGEEMEKLYRFLAAYKG